MSRVKFSRNWNNKLDCKFFTTLRLDEDQFEIGKTYDIYLLEGGDFKPYKRAKCVGVKRLKFNQLSQYLIAMDIGKPLQEGLHMIRRMYDKKVDDWNTQKFVYPLFESE